MSLKKVKKNQRRFKYWYFREEGQRMLLQWEGRDILVEKIICYTASETKYQTYPQCLVQGWAEHVHFEGPKGSKIAVIV